MAKSRKSSYRKTNNRKSNKRKINKNSQKLRRRKTNKRRRNRRTMKGGTASRLHRRALAGPYRLSSNLQNSIPALKTFGQSYEKKTRGLHTKTKPLPRSPLAQSLTDKELYRLKLGNILLEETNPDNDSSDNDIKTKTTVSPIMLNSISLKKARNRLTGNPRHKRGKKRQSIISRLRFPRPRLSLRKSEYKVQRNTLINNFKENNNETEQNNWGAVSV